MIWDDGSQIIYRQATKDLKITLPKNGKLSDIKLGIVKELRKKSNKELLDEKSELEVEILRTELYNIDTFMSIRFAFYAIVIALILVIKEININNYIGLIFSIMAFMLITFRCTSDNQKNRLLYYKFKLKCIEELLNINIKSKS
ncbi:hypothetical protein [Clostridium aciditolerans]|uniref:Uncharacterized protein n=1 Tax=Clostridium aciditolerans TaxID=339861 RepID=A0A934I2H7_9CLOT|nr:hypothetical protein [Clostridium aciditolerans]MBI6875619.1 hypothetical protein [Clostridium aciditolerans]